MADTSKVGSSTHIVHKTRKQEKEIVNAARRIIDVIRISLYVSAGISVLLFVVLT